MTTPQEIVRCVKRDMNRDLLAGAAYCERISAGSRLNPWAEPQMSAHYAEAARRLRAEHEERILAARRCVSSLP